MRSKLKSILDVSCVCLVCGWQGSVGGTEPDVDGDGNLGCPKCFKIVKILEDRPHGG